jgi:hypothetical protein
VQKLILQADRNADLKALGAKYRKKVSAEFMEQSLSNAESPEDSSEDDDDEDDQQYHQHGL